MTDYLYRPAYKAKGVPEWTSFDNGLNAANVELTLLNTHRLLVTNAHGLIYTGNGSGGLLDADLLDGNHASAFALSGHNHDLAYAALGHNHDLVYAPIVHAHDAAYLKIDQTVAQTIINGWPTFQLGWISSDTCDLTGNLVIHKSGAKGTVYSFTTDIDAFRIRNATGNYSHLGIGMSIASGYNYIQSTKLDAGDLLPIAFFMGTTRAWDISTGGHLLSGGTGLTAQNITTTGTLGAGAITGTSFIIGANTLSSFANLASLAGLSYVSTSFVKMTGANTFALDTDTYSLSSHNHSGVYDPAGTGHTEATDHVATHAALTTGIHGLAITAGQTLTVTTGGTLGTAAYTAATAYDAAGVGHTEASDHVSTHAALITGVHGLVFTALKTLTLTESLTLNALPIGGLAVATAANTLGSLTVGATTQILVGGGAGVVPAWGIDLPTAVTIGSGYIYRAGGTDIPLADGGTNASLTASVGGIFYSTATAGAILSGTATANKVLMSGASAAPTWSTPTFPNASATARKMITSDGTNWVASTELWPVPGVAGLTMYSDGTNWVTLAAGATTTILVGGGAAAPVWTTATGTGAPVRAGSPTFTTQLTVPQIVAPADDTFYICDKNGAAYVKFDTANHFIGFGTLTNIEYDLEIQGLDGYTTIVGITSYGSNLVNVPQLIGKRAFGTAASPSAVQANHYLFVFGARGYTGSAFSLTKTGFYFMAAENWSTTANGTYITFQTTAIGSTSRLERMRIMDTGMVGIGPAATAPLSMLSIDGGLHVGGMSAAGDNNLLVDGTGTITGAFGCNGATAQTAYASGGALAAYATGAFGLDSGANMSALHALVVKIRAALVAQGTMS